jgi:hypothetical protein
MQIKFLQFLAPKRQVVAIVVIVASLVRSESHVRQPRLVKLVIHALCTSTV